MAGWTGLLGADPMPRLAASEDPAARWVAAALLSEAPDEALVSAEHRAVQADPRTEDLVSRLTEWGADIRLSGHDKPAFAPNLLALLADRGVCAADDPRIAALLEAMLQHQDTDGRFESRAAGRTGPGVWSALLCDTHAITEALVREGMADDPRVRRALDRIAADLADTAQGRAWPCRPDPATGFRGPGRVGDACPQVTLEALRAFSWLPRASVPAEVVAAGRVSLRCWRMRGAEKPYQFGHGRQFKQVKWPATWYGALALVDTIGRYPELWSGPGADPDDRRALAEVAACLIAYNVGADGLVTPRSCFTGFAAHSFGRRDAPSEFATARVMVALRRLRPIWEDVRAVDVLALPSSKGGSGVAMPPR